MNDGWRLLRAIEAGPADDGPRLAYADWLEENDKPQRAEFIRLQVARGTGQPTAREAELLAAHQEEWQAELGFQLVQPRFQRGFANPVFFNACGFIEEAGRRAAAVAPLHHAQLFDFPSWAEHVAPSPLLGHVRRLSLLGNSLRQDHVSALAGSPHLVNLELLNLQKNHLGIAACEALARANLPSLRWLNLSENPVRERGLAALLAAPWASRLESLELYGCQLGPSSPGLLASIAPGLRRLDLGAAQGLPRGAVAGLVTGPLPRLEFLGLNHLATDAAAGRAAANPSLRGLRELWVLWGPANAWARAVLDSPNLANLRRLRIHWPTDARLASRLQKRFGPELNPDLDLYGEWDDSPLLPAPAPVG